MNSVSAPRTGVPLEERVRKRNALIRILLIGAACLVVVVPKTVVNTAQATRAVVTRSSRMVPSAMGQMEAHWYTEHIRLQ